MIATSASFVMDFDLQRLGSLTATEADTLPYGVIKLDDQGNILLYNQYNTDHFLYEAHEVAGKNYFSEVVPCSNNFMFKGRFFRGVEAGNLNTIFDFVFTYRIQPTPVKIHLYRDPVSKSNWIFVKKK